MTDNGVQFTLPTEKPGQPVFSRASHQPSSDKILDPLAMQKPQEGQPVFTSANVGTMLNQSMDMVRLMLGSAVPPQALPVPKSVFTLDKPLNGNTVNAKAPKKNNGSLIESILGIDWAEMVEGNETASTVQDWLGQIKDSLHRALAEVDDTLRRFQDAVVRLDKLTDDKLDRISKSVQDRVMRSIRGTDRDDNS